VNNLYLELIAMHFRSLYF